MKTEKHSYENPSVDRIVADVRAGIRSKEDLEFCGCRICLEALKILGRERKTTLDPITDEYLKKWEQAGGNLAKATREVRADMEKEASE